MTTIRLKFRPSTVKDRPGTLYYQLCRRKIVKRFNTGIRILPSQWDPIGETLLADSGSDTLMAKYRQTIERDLRLLRGAVREMELSRTDYTLDTLIHKLENQRAGIDSRAYIEQDIASLESMMRLGTARNRRKTLNSFSAFLGSRTIPVSEWNRCLISEYEEWLQRRKVSRNTISFYMRSLRSVYNKAVKEGLTFQSHPFQDVYTGIDKTRKRAVSENIMIRLMQLDLSRSRSLDLTRDMFVFSYCTRGMSFVDMVLLRRSDIRGDCIFYTRRKTGQKMCVRIEPCMKYLIHKYSLLHPESPYVFPAIRPDSEKGTYRQYQTALGYYNRKLKRLSRLLGLDTPLTSYTARHTWATTARNHNTPIAIISSGMGHTSEKTTKIYLAAIDESVIDRANRSILAPLNKAVMGFSKKIAPIC